MSTYTQILYQVVFGTKYREPTLTSDSRKELYKCISGILNNNNCHLYQIGGVEDHVHIILHLHPAVSLSRLVKDIKLGSTSFIKEKKLFQNFNGWQEGYGAFTYSIEAKENLVNYVKNQEEHHHKRSFSDEYRQLLSEHQVEYEEKYLL